MHIAHFCINPTVDLMPTQLRPVAESDIDELTSCWIDLLDEQGRLEERFGASDDAEERWRNDLPSWIRDERRLLHVAVSDEQIAGFVRAHRWTPAPVYVLSEEVFIDELYVRPDYRRRGIGRELLEVVEAWAEERELTRLRLSALHRNESGRRFWKAVGATPFAVEMTKELQTAEKEEAKPTKRRIGF